MKIRAASALDAPCIGRVHEPQTASCSGVITHRENERQEGDDTGGHPALAERDAAAPAFCTSAR